MGRVGSGQTKTLQLAGLGRCCGGGGGWQLTRATRNTPSSLGGKKR
jgi:hypothetical protein